VGWSPRRIGSLSPARGRTVEDAKHFVLILCRHALKSAWVKREWSAQANAWMLSVNSAIVGLYGYLQADQAAVGAGQRLVWLWAIPAAGVLVCAAWALLLTSYRKLNRAKFTVLMDMEADLPSSPFTREREIYSRAKRRALSYIETLIPLCFGLLYAALLAVAIRTQE
jgi:hypothetical protein